MEQDIYTLGIDIGSSSSKAVVLKNGDEIAAKAVVGFGTGTSGPERVLAEIKAQCGRGLEEMDASVVTGYGRSSFTGAGRQISELSCHARGVKRLVPTAGTIIDIGGQDVKAINVGPDGSVQKFFMNDKCAAGTGRFLEVMSRVLETDVESLEKLDAAADYPAPISSTCTVFAESEVISQLSKGEKRENIVAGIHQSVAVKAMALACRGGIRDDVVLTGGGALNAGVKRAVEREMHKPVTVPAIPQFTGALGAALFAYDDALKKKGMEK